MPSEKVFSMKEQQVFNIFSLRWAVYHGTILGGVCNTLMPAGTPCLDLENLSFFTPRILELSWNAKWYTVLYSLHSCGFYLWPIPSPVLADMSASTWIKKRLSCHADLYTVSRCHTRGESENHTGEKAHKKGCTLVLTPKADVTRSPKQGYQ